MEKYNQRNIEYKLLIKDIVSVSLQVHYSKEYFENNDRIR